MPFISIATSVKRSSVDVDTVLKAVSKTLSDVLEVPEIYVMANVEFDRDMLQSTTTEPCAFVNVRTKGGINAERNPNTVAVLSEAVATVLGVAAERVFINLNSIPGENWGYLGKVLPN